MKPTAAALMTALAICLASQALATSGQKVVVHDDCRNTAAFDRWLIDFKNEAVTKQRIDRRIVDAAAPSMQFDPDVVRRDRAQGIFQLTFLQFSDRIAGPSRLRNGQAMMQRNAALLARVEKDYGVPAAVLMSFWGLESDYGTNTGKHNIIRALTTLAYDCRRTEFFRAQLFDALRILQRGDLTLADMNKGDWAGELGAMQFTASDYYKYSVDYDRDGRRDLVNSTPDALATAANFLKELGWKRGEPWLQEVRVPADMPWQEANLEVQHPRSQWAAWGVTAAQGALPSDTMPASLLLPMGRHGPAFLAYDNFKAFLGWNQAMVYSTTAAHFATRLAGAPPLHRGNGTVTPLTPQQMTELQMWLARNGHDVGKIDGKLGAQTRIAVRKVQLQFGLPADAYPSPELIEKIRGDALGAAR